MVRAVEQLLFTNALLGGVVDVSQATQSGTTRIIDG